MSYEAFRKSWGPTMLKGPVGQAWQGAHGRFNDALVSLWKAGVTAGFPDECPADALPLLGAEIGIPRSPADTDDTYRAKLRRAWELWPFAGTPLGLLLALEAAGYAAGQVVIVQQEAHAFGLDTDTTKAPGERLVKYALIGGRWTFTSSAVLWNRFAVLFPDSTNLPTGWASAAEPPTTLTTPSLDEVNGLIRLINKWKRSAAIFMGIEIAVDGRIWGWPVTQEWGDVGATWGWHMIKFGPSEY